MSKTILTLPEVVSHITAKGSGIFSEGDITITGGSISAISTRAGAAILKCDGRFSTSNASIAIHTESTYNMAIYSKGLSLSAVASRFDLLNTSMGTLPLWISTAALFTVTVWPVMQCTGGDMTFSED